MLTQWKVLDLGMEAGVHINSSQIQSFVVQQKSVEVCWQDGLTAKFHKTWLRENCSCEKCFHSKTQQRMVDPANFSEDLSIEEIASHENSVLIVWGDSQGKQDCRKTVLSSLWLRENRVKRKSEKLLERELWQGEAIKNFLPQVSYDEFMQEDSNSKRVEALKKLYQYGILLVSHTPSSEVATEQFAKRVGLIQASIYGTIWTTNLSEATTSYLDTASSNCELQLHTDCSYHIDPPGIQIFNCIAQASVGGASRFLDGFAVAQFLRDNEPETFKFFSEKELMFQCYDQNVHLKTYAPIIKLDHKRDVTQVRFNNYDRGPLNHLTFAEIEEFYEHHKVLMKVLQDPARELSFSLEKKAMIVIDNHRVMHGRYEFTGERTLIGCYLGKNEYDSNLRVLGIIN